MPVNPYELSDETFDKLVDLTMDIFGECLGCLSEVEGNTKLANYITKLQQKHETLVMVDYPHPEWWPDHDMFADTASITEGTEQGSSADNVSAEENELNSYFELSVVAATANDDEDDAEDTEDNVAETAKDDDSEQIVLAAILFPVSLVSHLDEPSEDDLAALEIQWLPERNVLEQDD